jgi:uncharacterized protein (UPF0332 family)/predicted nucleotidyltransferase
MIENRSIVFKITESVRATNPDATIILYGSFARGENRPDSDLDILILLNKDKVTREDEKSVKYPLYDIEFETGQVISPLVLSKPDWENRHRITPFYLNVLREGVILWNCHELSITYRDENNLHGNSMCPDKSNYLNMNESERLELANYRIKRAKETLLEINILIENQLWGTAINRLYYACYYAVIALLVKNNISTQTHGGTRQMFGLHFVKTGLIQKELGKFYSDIFDKRQTGDYDDFIELNQEDVIGFVEPARRLVAEIEIILLN